MPFILIDVSPIDSPNGISGDIDNITNSATTDSTDCFFLDGQTLRRFPGKLPGILS